MQKTNKAGKIIAIIITIGIVGAALYLYANQAKPLQDNVQVQQNGRGGEQANVTPTNTPTATLTVKPSKTAEPTPSLVGSKSMTFFIDKNRDLTKNADEATCGNCKNKTVLTGVQNGETSPVMSIREVQISADNRIADLKVENQNLVWAVFPELSLMIPPTNFAFGDGASDLQIPVWEITGEIAGINANVTSAAPGESGVTYNFSVLIPSMKTAFTNRDDIWVKYTPDAAVPNTYYLSKGKLNNAEIGYYLNIDWSCAGNTSNLLSVANVQFVIK